MSQFLPYGNYEWESSITIDEVYKILQEYNLTDKELDTFLRLIKKLLPTLNSRIEYVLHINNLKLNTQLGLKIAKVHCSNKE